LEQFHFQEAVYLTHFLLSMEFFPNSVRKGNISRAEDIGWSSHARQTKSAYKNQPGSIWPPRSMKTPSDPGRASLPPPKRLAATSCQQRPPFREKSKALRTFLPTLEQCAVWTRLQVSRRKKKRKRVQQNQGSTNGRQDDQALQPCGE
jgi:hypothetical protein